MTTCPLLDSLSPGLQDCYRLLMLSLANPVGRQGSDMALRRVAARPSANGVLCDGSNNAPPQ